MAYKIIAKNEDAYAIQDTLTGEVEALPSKYVEIGLILGITVDGASLDKDCHIQFDPSIQDFELDDEYDDDEEYEEDYDEEEYDEDYDDEEEYEEYYEEEYEEDYDDEYEEEEEYIDDYEYEDDIYTKDSSVGKLYSYLSEEQIKILKRYYLWFSQRIFSDAQKDPTLGMKDQNRLKAKQKDLASLRNLGGMWHYAGFVDTGYDGGGYCTLGHKLRYMHLAWDVSVSDIESAFFGDKYNAEFEKAIESNNCIVFGIKCVSDFFEVGAECTRALQKAQRDSLKDMDEMYLQYENNEVDEIINSFTLMDNLMLKVKRTDSRGVLLGGTDYKPVLPANLTAFYFQFREANMPVPRSLIYEIRCNLVGWEPQSFYGRIKVPTSKFRDNMLRLLGKKYEPLLNRLFYDSIHSSYLCRDYTCLVQYFMMIWYVYEICGHFKYNGETNTFEGGKGKVVKSIFAELYNTIKRRFWADADFTDEFMAKLLVFDDLYYNKLEPVYNNIFNEKISNYDYPDEDIISYRELVDIQRKLRDLHQRPCNESYSVTYNIDSAISIIEENLERYQTNMQKYKNILERKRQEDEKLEKQRALVHEQMQRQLEEVKEEKSEVKIVTIEDVNNFLKTYDLDLVNDSKFDFSKRLVKDSILNGREPSSKQQYYINKLYKHITGNDIQSPTSTKGTEKKYLADFADYGKAIDFVLSSKEDDFVKTVCKSVKKYGTFTEKQQKYLEQALERYKENEGRQE